MKDLTTGNPFQVILRFTLPMLFSMIFQQVYSVVDSIVAGKYIGVNALGAVGASQPITAIFIAVAVGTGMGINVVISNFFGARKYKRVKSTISTSVITVVIMSVILTVLGSIGCNGMLKLLSTPTDIFSDAALYLKIYIWGIIFLMLYNAATSIFTALGDSMTPLVFLIFSSVLNIILDVVFVTCFHMGVSGVAWATFIAQGIASVLAVITVFIKVKKIKTPAYKKFNTLLLRKVMTIAVPSIMQQSFVSIGQLFVQGRINSFGAIVVAGYSAAFKIQIFILAALSTVSNAISSFIAQNLGAGKTERMRDGIKIGLKMIFSMSVIFFLVCYFMANPLMELFMDGKTQESLNGIKVGVGFLHIVTPFYMIICIKFIYDGALRGMEAMKGFMASTFADLIARVVLSFLFSIPFGYIGIWWAWPVGWFIGTCVSIYCGKKELKKY
ncbi:MULTISPECIES: MATE family efflux transporter [Anaerostipes]|uniref:MATE family efflux transporter n=1 Tax=Anaerostipes TaxID=207244 RepID=UPI0009518B62|nr:MULTISPECIES: MATE family efflux transporter [Anaerostipes]MCI5624206.1 MATE family efflux transporter [Anaerostipes sp.]MDY2725724.1 MATE family efflux transporter [Anaerostipes faecalis]OLR59714.1 MATE family efflux transporter [Anaerostipes sp. 494a]